MWTETIHDITGVMYSTICPGLFCHARNPQPYTICLYAGLSNYVINEAMTARLF